MSHNILLHICFYLYSFVFHTKKTTNKPLIFFKVPYESIVLIIISDIIENIFFHLVVKDKAKNRRNNSRRPCPTAKEKQLLNLKASQNG